ncbi:hypothetical protein M3Y97_00817200 [Aphelenchoides bicaudatus]|nr:hypothetical protein M3Y97_00817200 [Aphelenchoides bicaudatus]
MARFLNWRLFILIFGFLLNHISGNLLTPGIVSEEVELLPNTQEFIGFLQSALKGTEVELRLKCDREEELELDVRFAIRSSPCSKEFFVGKSRFSEVTNLLAFYFNEQNAIPSGYSYNSFYYYKSKPFSINCKEASSVDYILEEHPRGQMELRNVTKSILVKDSNVTIRAKRALGLNDDTIDGGAKMTLTSWHPAIKLPADAAYLMIVQISSKTELPGDKKSPKITVEAQWRGAHGFLSAIDQPLLTFYGFMSFFYIVLAAVWFSVCFKHYKDLLRIQYWIGIVIIIGLLEKALFYAEYENMNNAGRSYEGLIESAELISCLKRTVAHVLVIIVACGYGVVKPRLGNTLNQVLLVGCLYFLLCAIEGLTRVSMRSTESMKEKQIAKVPLAFLEVLIAWWIFTSLVATMRTLSIRQNHVKLALYRQLTNVLALSLGVAVIFMMWSLYIHVFQRCMTDWKELWVDTAFWHLFFVAILVMIMILWRPSQNNQRYAFTPLLDDSEDEADDVLYDQSGLYTELKQRNPDKSPPPSKLGKQSSIGDDLDWIEQNIPTSLAEALVDDDEEREQRQLEMSKML